MKDKQKKKGNNPLLYIHQPNFVQPKLTMQQTFSSKENATNTIANTSPAQEKQRKSKPLQMQTVYEDLEDESENNDHQAEKPKLAADYFRNQANSTKKTWKLTPVKAFKQMSIHEKIQYLLQIPRTQPPFPCEFVLENERIRGILESKEGDIIRVKNFKGEVSDIVIRDLQSIRIIF
ncbi:spore coat CotO family protein [Lederbergia sp. NSJ-179]|uniref:CotO family spore coat protein n=1 Tax=Lederbergia sp. NSJ-179 TaxID=2931402 RepID=UPI001FCFDB1D|nr:CotO family spore coat protein [Lederbergia sp. NSJ-179]MCJ7840346.1 spore coat CotO family protein [Lederbergia sp. NSJ-179]